MRGITIGLLVAAGVAGLWAAQRATAQRRGPEMGLQDQRSPQPDVPATATPSVNATPTRRSNDPIDPHMVKTPKGDIDPHMVINPPPPRSLDDKSNVMPRANN